MTRQSLISRRRVLGVFGAGTTVALAGCSGNGQEGSGNGDSGSGGNGTDSPSDSGGTSGDNGSGTEETDSGSQDTEDSDSTGSTGNEPGEYPTQETSGEEAELDELADKDPLYSFTIDDYDFLNVEEFPEVERDDLTSYDKALYFATSFEDSRPTEEIYFICDSREERPITMYYRGEGGSFDGGNSILADEENSDMSQEEFFRDHVDPDGIVHAVDLDEHDYAVEALHSGFGSE